MNSTRPAVLLAMALTFALTSSAQAQEAWKRRIDLTLGAYSAQASESQSQSGVLLDALLAGERNTENRWAKTGGGGVALYTVKSSFGAAPDQCEVVSGTLCRQNGGLTSIYAVGGLARTTGSKTTRALIGPAILHGLDANSIGVQAQVDLNAMFASRAGIGAMLRGVVMPSHGGQSLSLFSGGVSIAFR